MSTSPQSQPLSLDGLVREGLVRQVLGDGNVVVRDVRHDSRRVEPGDLFVAIDGASYDGASFVEDAIARGAAAVLAARPLEVGVPVAVCDAPQAALGRIAARIHGMPSLRLPVLGITGTNGKTTVAYLVESMLSALGLRPAVTGTVSFRGPQGERPATHTTPMGDDVQRLMREALDAGASHFVMEVSSHALDQHRVDDVRFEVAAFTNLSHDHLDYHGTWERYRAAKARLFTDLAPRHGVFNVDDPVGAAFASQFAGSVWSCSARGIPHARVRVLDWGWGREGLRADLSVDGQAHRLQSPLVGAHNLDNLLVALGCGLALGQPADAALRGLAAAPGAPGRLERVPDPRGTLVLVDYAHTPDALVRALDALRPLTPGRLWVVFGAGGDRDRRKRPLMGRAAAERADLVVVTSDNPRKEAPAAIAEEVVAGITGLSRVPVEALADVDRGYGVEVERATAIELSLAGARPEDTVLIAGKGHETYQVVGDRRLPFDDRVHARRVLLALEGAG